MVYMKSMTDNSISVSEINSTGIECKGIHNKFRLNSGCAGLAFKTKETIFEAFAQSSSRVDKYEIDPSVLGITVKNIIAAPIFNEEKNSIGVFEALNNDNSVFTTSTKSLLDRFSKFISLLFYTNNLLMVIFVNLRIL